MGGLGGLGRSISTWMVQRGARRFVFLSPSGGKKRAAQSLLDDLERIGVQATVVGGDVCVYEDVKRAVSAAKSPIRGVIQAAMVLMVRIDSRAEKK